MPNRAPKAKALEGTLRRLLNGGAGLKIPLDASRLASIELEGYMGVTIPHTAPQQHPRKN